MFRLELGLQRHLGGREVDPVPGPGRPLVLVLRPPVTWLPVHDAAPGGHRVGVHLVLVAGHTGRPHTRHHRGSAPTPPEGRMSLTGQAVSHPARAREPRPVRPVRAAHGALTGPGRGPGAEGMGL